MYIIKISIMAEQCVIITSKSEHKLNSTWSLYYHPFNSVDWSINGYTKLLTLETIEDYHIMNNYINKDKNMEEGMYYLMRDPYIPVWEHELNVNGGGWTFKQLKSDIHKFWTGLSSYIVTESISSEPLNIVGISTSPKTTFTTIRIWNKNINSSTKGFVCDQKRNVNFSQSRFTPNINK